VKRTRGQLRIEPGAFEQASDAKLELVVPFTVPTVTQAVLERAESLTAGLNARISLVAVHSVPYASTFGCPSSTHAFLVEQLVELSAGCRLPVHAQVVLARSRDEGLQYVLRPGSTVLLGSRRRRWRTPEERLARKLAGDGNNVVLVYVD
jgi:hypothetical protein